MQDCLTPLQRRLHVVNLQRVAKARGYRQGHKEQTQEVSTGRPASAVSRRAPEHCMCSVLVHGALEPRGIAFSPSCSLYLRSQVRYACLRPDTPGSPSETLLTRLCSPAQEREKVFFPRQVGKPIVSSPAQPSIASPRISVSDSILPASVLRVTTPVQGHGSGTHCPTTSMAGKTSEFPRGVVFTRYTSP